MTAASTAATLQPVDALDPIATVTGEECPTFDAVVAEHDAECRWEVGPIPKLDGHTCRCNRLRWHALPHTCDCGGWFEGCGQDRREVPRRRDARGRFVKAAR